MHHTVGVRVRDRLGDLPQDGKLVRNRDALALLGQPQIQALEPLVERVHQADAEVAVDHVGGAQQSVVGQPGHDPILMLGDSPHRRPRHAGRTGRGDQEPDPRPSRRGYPVKRRPVLPALALTQRILIDDPGPRLALPPLDDPDPGHQLGYDFGAPGRDALVRRRSLEQAAGDPGQAGLALPVVQAEQIDARGGRQQALKVRMMQEYRFLHVGYGVAGIRDPGAGFLRPDDQLVLQLAGKALGLAPG